MSHHGFLHLFAAEDGVGYTGSHPVSFLHRVLQAESHRLHTQLLGQLIDDAFHGKGGLRLARSPIGLNLLLVADHVIAVDQHVLDVIGAQAGQSAAPHRGTGECARLIGQV